MKYGGGEKTVMILIPQRERKRRFERKKVSNREQNRYLSKQISCDQ